MSEAPQTPFERDLPKGSEMGTYFGEDVESSKRLMEAGEYSVAFGSLSNTLNRLTAQGHDIYRSENQREARRALKTVWGYFVRDISSRKQLDQRLTSIEKATDVEVRQGVAEGPQAPKPELQSASRQGVDGYVTASVARFLEPIEAPHAQGAQEMIYVANMYNVVLPMLRRQIEGYVAQMIKGQAGFLIDPDMIRTRIINFLDTAPTITTALTVAELEWEKTKTKPRQSKR
ncbi:MAG: hypothetical protein WC880_02595 [Candidatus Paceibacterota bacterium]